MKKQSPKNLFISYAQVDSEIVEQFIALLNRELEKRRTPVDIWMDRAALRPGEQWQDAIKAAVLNSVGMLVFVSPASMQSDWVKRELETALSDEQRLVIPVIVAHVNDLPSALVRRQWLDISTARFDKDELLRLVDRLASDIHSWILNQPAKQPLPASGVQKFAELAANNARAATTQINEPDLHPPDSVFVVHGHDTAALQLVCKALVGLGVRPVVLSQLEGSAQSLLQKFFNTSKQARFAIVLLTSDDFGASRLQYETEGVADRALQFRARQNVILELGFFYGHLGWENVFVLFKKASKVFPNFERPSDLEGAVFDIIDEDGKWKSILAKKLKSVGFQIHRTETIKQSE